MLVRLPRVDVVAQRHVGWPELPWLAMLGWCALTAALWAGGLAWWRQRAARQRAEEEQREGGGGHGFDPVTRFGGETQRSARVRDTDAFE